MSLIKNIRHTGLIVNDLAKTVWFYGELLGFKIIHSERLDKEYAKKLFHGMDIDITYLKMNLGPDVLEFYYFHNKQRVREKTFEHIAMTTENADALYKLFQEKGIFCLGAPTYDPAIEHKLFFALDPSENLIEFVQKLEFYDKAKIIDKVLENES